MLRNESLQARKSLSGTPPFRLRLLFVCLFVCLRSIEMNNILTSEYYSKKEMICKGELQ